MLQQDPPEGGGRAGSGDDVEASPSSDAWQLAMPIRTFSLPGFSDRRLRCVAELPPSDADLLWEGVDTTGRKVWLGSEQLLHWLSASSDQAGNREAWRGQSVIELGCGAGLVGLFVSQLGPASYTYSDGSGETVELARANVQLNGSSSSSEGCVSSFVQLAWGEAEAAGRVVAEAEGGEGRGFDRVLACDVIYDRGVLPLLMRTAAVLLAPGESSEFLLSYVSRCVMPEAEMVGLIYQHAASQGLVGRHVAAADLRIGDWRVRQELVEADGKLFVFKHRPEGGGTSGQQSVAAERAAAESTEPR